VADQFLRDMHSKMKLLFNITELPFLLELWRKYYTEHELTSVHLLNRNVYFVVTFDWKFNIFFILLRKFKA
jgi:hypothetical protein